MKDEQKKAGPYGPAPFILHPDLSAQRVSCAPLERLTA
jgi:hypothetical protein